MNIYFSGIGGVGIGPLALVSADAGYSVQGSDISESLLTKELETRGVPVELTQDGSFLQSTHDETPVDWFVHTAALPDDHPELVLARTLGIKTAKRDELIARIIEEKDLKLIAVSGTHGKTTTTGMLLWTFKQLGIPVSYSVGTTLSFGPSGVFDPVSEYFVYECDEFDRNFLHFKPYLSLITTIDYDHPDTYPTKQDYLAAFKQFGEQSKQLIAWQSEHSELFNGHPDAWLLDETFDIKLAGAHNRRNATLVVKTIEKLASHDNLFFEAAAEQHEIADTTDVIETTKQVIATFPGTNRRFERLADNLYSDYGHHPVEIAAMLQLAREVSDNVILVYQPHQNVRQHKVKNDYCDQFELAETVYWLPTYLSREDPNLPILAAQELIKNVTNKDDVHKAGLDDELWNVIQKARNENRLILCMGAGSIDSWLRQQLKL